MIDFQYSKINAITWWKKYYKNYGNFLVESNPFDKKSKARRTEWDAIYNSFRITPKNYPALVDFGCGSGHFALNFLKKGFEVTGIDISSEALTILKERALKYGLSRKLHIVRAGLRKSIKNLEGKFDAGAMIVTYHCIPKDEQRIIFKNFVKLMRKGGKILIMEPNPLNPLYYIFYIFVYKNNFKEGFNIVNSRRETLIELLRDMGMGNMEIFYHSFLPTFFIRHWSFVKNINSFLCSIPVIRNFAAFNIISAVKF